MPTAVTTAGGKTGPAITVTSYTLPNVTSIFLEITRGVLTINYGNNQQLVLDYTQTVTVTDSISGTVSTIAFA